MLPATKPVRVLLIVLALLLGGAAAFTWLRAPLPFSAAPGTGAIASGSDLGIGGAFSLIDQDGRVVTDRDYRGRWAVLYFGYSFCPDVCPTSLSTLVAALDALGPEQGGRLQPIFVSIDPERDTPAQLKSYVDLFHPRLIGLTGSAGQVGAAIRAYRVYAAKHRPEGASDYLMDHSSMFYLLGPDGRTRAILRASLPAEELAAALSRQLAAGAKP